MTLSLAELDAELGVVLPIRNTMQGFSPIINLTQAAVGNTFADAQANAGNALALAGGNGAATAIGGSANTAVAVAVSIGAPIIQTANITVVDINLSIG